MGRPKEFEYSKLPREVVGVAVAVIADYGRRKREIERGALSEGLLSSYLRYNGIVDSAFECIEEGARRELMDDISVGRGWHTSKIGYMYTLRSYYIRKRQVIYTVAVGLGLTEIKG